jgi:hypothetical protein
MQHSISVSVSGASLPELRKNLAAALAGLDGATTDSVPVTEESAPVATRKPRATKAEKETALANGKDDSNIFADTPPAATPAPSKAYTKDDVNTAVQNVLNKVGGAETRKLLGKFGATSTGAVKVEDYGKLIAECEKLSA